MAKNQDVLDGAGGGGAGGNFENLSTAIKLTKSKKPKLTQPKRSDFEKTNSSGTDFLTSEAKKAFIHLRKAFTKAPILRHFQIETDASGYAISGIFSQMTMN